MCYIRFTENGLYLKLLTRSGARLMPDRSIPFYNIILKCENNIDSEIILPDGYSFRNYQPGDEKSWARLEYEIGDFETPDTAEDYFVSTYCQDLNILKERCIFVLNRDEKIVGSCIAWRDKQGRHTVASLHWLIVSPEYQGKHLGKALCQKVLNIFQESDEFPVYIHTQPWSYIAVLLYIRLGFCLQTSDTFSHYVNQYTQSMEVLKNILTEEQYDELLSSSV